MVKSYEKKSVAHNTALNIDTSMETNHKIKITLEEIHVKNAQLFQNLDKISKYHMKICRIYYYLSMIILIQRFYFIHSILLFLGFVVMNVGIFLCSNVFLVTLFTFIFTLFDIILIIYDIIFFNNESVFTTITIAMQIAFWIKILYEIVLWKTDEYWVFDLQTNTKLKEHMPRHLKQAITYQDTMRIEFSHIYNSGPILICLTHLAGIEANKFIKPKDRETKLKKKWIDPYDIDMSIFEKHWNEYVTMNEWFGRRLKLKNSNGSYIPSNYAFRNLPKIIENFAVSPGDCRMMVFPELNDVSKWWIKGEQFDIETLVDIQNFPNIFGNLQPTDFCMMISRLAVQDYHCFHSPITAKILKHHKVLNENTSYFGVNPLLLQHRNDVLKTNVREILVMQGNGISQNFGRVIYIILGAAMVGSIEIEEKIFTEQNGQVKIGDYLGKFQFGGSTIITLFEKNRIKFHENFISASRQSVETRVCLLNSVGKAIIRNSEITPYLLKLSQDTF